MRVAREGGPLFLYRPIYSPNTAFTMVNGITIPYRRDNPRNRKFAQNKSGRK